MIDRPTLWLVMVVLGLGTYLIRFSFLGGLGSRSLPGWMIRGLRFTAVAMLPALVAPGVLWPAATGGQPDAARMLAALVTVAAGILSRSMIAAILCGAATLYAVPFALAL
jgi:branched-subunit amino acid transport protein